MARNKNLAHKRAARLVKGLIIEWDDPDPLIKNGTVRNERVSHRNPITRTAASDIWAKYGEHIVNNRVHKWRVDIAIETAEYMQHIECIATDKLSDIADACQPPIDEETAGLEVINVHFKIECLGI